MLLPHLETAVLVLILPFFSSASTSPRPLHQIRTRQLPLSTPITQNATFQPIFKMGFFDQLVEHSNPKIGNFVQRYIYHENYWKGPGSPIILVAGGEFSISYSSNGTNAHDHGIIEDHTAVVLAKRIGAAVLAIEHRYFGTSVPFMNLTDMRYNSVENSIADLINFARTVRLPFDPTGNSHAPQVPWVLVGCSAAGAISAWLERREPGTFWAYHLFSATVQVEPAWSYTIPILDNIPKNCSRDASMVWEYMDDIAVHGTKQDRLKLQADFGLAKIETYEEFATTVFHYSFERFQTDPDFVPIFCLVLTSSPKTNLTNTALYANQTKIAPFSNQTTTIPTNNKDLNRAFKNYAQFVHLMYNADDDPQWKTLSNASSTTSLAPKINTPDADDFAYEWWDCKWPTGDSVIAPPAGYPLLISRLINTSYRKKICDYYFPSNNTLPHNSLHYRTIDEMNQWTGSWSDRPGSKRMLFINGKLDPWLHLTVSSRFRPGGSMKSTGDVVVKTMSKETHCPTYLGCLEREVECKKVVEESMAQLQKWVLEFPGRTNWTRTGLRNM